MRAISVDHLTRPVIYFDMFFATGNFGVRQEFLHVVKILHEIAHIFTPLLMNYVYHPGGVCDGKKWTTPQNIGTIRTGKGDSGSAFEELVLGGRVLPHHEFVRRPYQQMLQLRRRKFLHQ